MTRARVGALVLVAWLGVLGWHVRREYFRPEAEQLEAAVRTLPPGVAYYSVYRGARRAGWARIEIDTLPGATGFRIREQLELSLPGLGAAGVSERRGEAWLGPRLALDSVETVTATARDTMRVAARVRGDTLLRVEVAAGGTVEIREGRVRPPLDLPAGWPLRLAARGEAGAGDRFAVRIFDPATGTVTTDELRVTEEAIRTFADSADTDSLTGEWMAVRHDTVRAWRVERAVGLATLAAWVDEDGRLLEAELPGGLRLERTAFELAFFGRPGATGDGADERRGTTGDGAGGEPGEPGDARPDGDAGRSEEGG